jgi:thiol-disulfide isomerase/thioredoxin
MVRTTSTMLSLGTALPSFELEIVQGTALIEPTFFIGSKRISNNMLGDQPILMMIICSHCPFVKHIEPELLKLDQDYRKRVQILAISSNSLMTHPQDGPENLALQAKQGGWSFPYLLDIDQSLAKSLKAACTPDFFLFAREKDGKQTLRYRGQLDDSRPGGNVPLTGEDLRAALDAVLDGKVVSSNQKPSIGCNIKWHPGQEPSWFG